MSSNPKRKRRIMTIAVVVVAAAAASGGAYALRQAQLDGRARAARDEGRAALARKDWDGALAGLTRFLMRLERKEATAADLRDYALALRHVPQSNQGHLYASISMLRKALDLDPNYRAAQDELLALYQEVGFATEALQLLDLMIAEHPKDVGLLRQRRDWLEAQRRYPEAFEMAKLVTGLAPRDFDGFVRAWILLTKSDVPPQDVSDWIDSVVSTHEDDPRFELLRAAEYSRRDQRDKGQEILDRFTAGKVDASDPKFVAFLVSRLDAVDRFADALVVLEKLGDDVAVPLRVELCRRLFYSNRGRELAARTADLAREGAETDPEALALRILVLKNSGLDADTAPARKALAAQDDPRWKAWQSFVVHVVDGGLAGGRAAKDDLTTAVAADPTSAILLKALGDAQSKLGEPDAAIGAWGAAGVRAPSWPAPLVSIARSLPPSRASESVRAARAALRCAPNDPETVATFVEVAARNADALDPGQVRAMLEAVDAFRKQAPEATADLLPAQIGLMMRTDPADAARRLRDAATSKASGSEVTLLRLARIAFEKGLPLEDDFLDLSEQTHGVTPQLALARALARARNGTYTAALTTFDELSARRAANTTDLDWSLVRAGLLDAAQEPEAGPAWSKIVAEHPDSLAAHLGALASPGVWLDRALAARVIERVRALTGEEASTWRVARGRWLLTIENASTSDLTEAVGVLEHVTRASSANVTARILHAQALERLGKLPQAQEQLLAAADLAPENTWVALELARIAHRAGDPDLALRQIDRALQSKDLPAPQAERAAYILALRGDSQRSADLLEPLAARAQTGRDGLLLLAQLYAKLGKTDRAIDLCNRLLLAPDAGVVALAADLYASLGRGAEAAEILAKLEQVGLRPGERELVFARHAARWGAPEDACDLYARAVAAAPARAELWNEYLVVVLSAGDALRLTRALDDPRAAAIEPVVYLRSIRALCDAGVGDERLRPLLAASVTDVPSRPVLADALRKVTEGWSDPARREETARSVRSLADANPRILTLQILASRLCTETGDIRGAGEVASRAAATFPDSAEATYRLYESCSKSARWEEALAAALKWRDRSEHGDLAAEVAVARVRLRLNRPVDAATGLEPFVQSALARAESNHQFLTTYALTLVRAGKVSQATELLQALVTASPQWRDRILEVGVASMGDAREAHLWLRTCTPLFAASDPAQRLKLARIWGSAWEALGSPELLAGAKQVLEAVVADPNAPAEAHLVRGTLLQRAGDTDAAAAAYLTAIERNPANTGARNNLAVLLADSGKWEQGVEQASLAIKAAPKRANYHDTLAYCYRKGRMMDKAVAAAEQAVRLEPANPEWLVSLAESLTAAGNATQALDSVERVRKLDAQGVQMTPDVRQRYMSLREPK